MRCTLVYPPLTDPTCGYLSLSYLAAAVRAERDYKVSIIDANIEALHFCSTDAHLAELQLTAEQTLSRLGKKRSWSKPDFRAYRGSLMARQLAPGAVRDAIAVMRSGSRFSDYAQYYPAALTLNRWLQALSLQGAPGMFSDFSIDRDEVDVNFCNLEELSSPDVLDGVVGPFLPYFRESLAPRLVREDPDVVGVGVTYHEQLPFSLALAREVRRALPAARIVLGGTDISQIWKFSRASQSYLRLLNFADAIVIGEGESALVSILDAYAAGREPSGRGILTRSSPDGGAGWGPVYENVDALPTPTFVDLPWHLYLSPEKFVYYAPTRGCYWDKCAFCDYGLSGDRPTSPWRQRSLERTLEDLRAISRESRFVYFSVDVIAPAYLVKLARAMIDARIDIRWGAELRLERYFDASHCEILRESGCVAVSVGFESGNQRILDLMDKGTKADQVGGVVRAFSKAGIAVQIMGFTGFPTETYREALDSVELLDELRDQWVFGGLGKFALTAGAFVAKAPERYGLVDVSPRPQDDVNIYLDFTEQRPAKSEVETAEVERRSKELMHPFELSRPFLGGTDTAHTYFYIAKYGKDVRARLDQALGSHDGSRRLVLCGQVLADMPAGAAQYINLGADLTEPGDQGCVLAAEDGRLLWCSQVVARLAPLLDGSLTLAEAVVRAEETLGLAPFRSSLHLRYLRDCGLLRNLPARPAIPSGQPGLEAGAPARSKASTPAR